MTLDELRERIKDEIVLHEGDVAEWEWQRKGLTAEAQQLGLSPDAFTRLVNQVSYAIAPDFGRISELKARIHDKALAQQRKLSEEDIRQFVEEADRVRLTRTFVTEQWIPAILAALPAAQAPEPKPAPVVPPPPVAPPPPAPAADRGWESRESVQRKIREILDEYDKHIPARNLSVMFKAISYDEQALAKEILTYLSEHYYASLKPPRGATLKERLLSTDWRHLSWWDKDLSEPGEPVPLPAAPVLVEFSVEPEEVKAGETATLRWKVENATAVAISGVGANLPPEGSRSFTPDRPVTYSMTDSTNRLLGEVTVNVRPKRSLADQAGLWGILLALLLAALMLWVVKESNEPDTDRNRGRSTVPETYRPNAGDEPVAVLESPQEEPAAPATNEDRDETDEATASRPARDSLRRTAQASPAPSRDYDEVIEAEGPLRPASRGGKWGFVDRDGKWVLPAVYEEVRPFRDGRATVLQEGEWFNINTNGERVE